MMSDISTSTSTPDTSSDTTATTTPTNPNISIATINSALDDVTTYYANFAEREAAYQEQIADLQAQVAAAATLTGCTPEDIANFRDKLVLLQDLIPDDSEE